MEELDVAEATQPTREEMVAFLRDHFRYDTMNSWNRSTSYARNVKIYNLGLTHEQEMRAHELLEVRNTFDEINEIIHEFGADHDFRWQAGFNGRSSGYIVLYQGGKRDKGYKTRCDKCSKLTWYEIEQPCKMDSCDGTLRLLKSLVFEAFSYPGKGVDMDEEFENEEAWSDDAIKDRYVLVKEFDQMADDCISIFKHLIDNFRVVEKEIPCIRKVKVLEPVAAEA